MKHTFQILVSMWLCFSNTMHAHSFVDNNKQEESAENSSYLKLGADIIGVCTNALGAIHSVHDLYTFNPLEPSKILYTIAVLDLVDLVGHGINFVGFSWDFANDVADSENQDSVMSSATLVLFNVAGLSHHVLRLVYKAYTKNKWEKFLYAHNICETGTHINNILAYFTHTPSDEKDSSRSFKVQSIPPL